MTSGMERMRLVVGLFFFHLFFLVNSEQSPTSIRYTRSTHGAHPKGHRAGGEDEEEAVWHENEASKVSRVEGIVRGGKDVVVSLHGRGSFTRFTCLFLEWMRWGYETEPKGTASIAHFIHLSWLLPSGLYVCRERKVMRRRWAGVPFPFTHRHLRPAHHHHFLLPHSFRPPTGMIRPAPPHKTQRIRSVLLPLSA